MSRVLTLALCTLAFVVGCSREPGRPTAGTPTSPSTATAKSAPAPGSLIGPTSVAPGGISGKFDVSFPPRNESFDFRNQLETKYRTGLGRSAAATFVDAEGEVVWTQEYMRYRTNGCDHASAVQRVLAQIDGQPAGAVCGAPPDGLIAFPPRTDSFDFRRTLESKYQQFGRGASSSAVDPEGGVIWTQEYLRYRVNACDHATSVQKVFSQIDGGGVAPTCFVPPCIFTISPATQAAGVAGGPFTATITRSSGECSFGVESLDSWLTLGSGTSGSGTTTTLNYAVAPNFGGARTGTIRVRWTNNSTLLQVNQAAGNALAFTMNGGATNCAITTTNTPCTFTVTSGTFSANAVYTWHIDYQYGGPASHDFSSTSPTFAFSQTCGGPGSTVGGTTTPLNVTLGVTDGNSTITAGSASGSQPALTIQFFTC